MITEYNKKSNYTKPNWIELRNWAGVYAKNQNMIVNNS